MSALTGEGVEELFAKSARSVLNKIDNGLLDVNKAAAPSRLVDAKTVPLGEAETKPPAGAGCSC